VPPPSTPWRGVCAPTRVMSQNATACAWMQRSAEPGERLPPDALSDCPCSCRRVGRPAARSGERHACGANALQPELENGTPGDERDLPPDAFNRSSGARGREEYQLQSQQRHARSRGVRGDQHLSIRSAANAAQAQAEVTGLRTGARVWRGGVAFP
jgi:hypothetical protein